MILIPSVCYPTILSYYHLIVSTMNPNISWHCNKISVNTMKDWKAFSYELIWKQKSQPKLPTCAFCRIRFIAANEAIQWPGFWWCARGKISPSIFGLGSHGVCVELLVTVISSVLLIGDLYNKFSITSWLYKHCCCYDPMESWWNIFI